MTTQATKFALTLATMLAVLPLGCDSETEDALDIEALVEAEVDPEFHHPRTIDAPVHADESQTADQLAAPEADEVPAVDLFLFPGESSWIPTCVLGTEICAFNGNGGVSSYMVNLSPVNLGPYQARCDVWGLGPYGGFVTNESLSAGPLSIQTRCPYGF